MRNASLFSSFGSSMDDVYGRRRTEEFIPDSNWTEDSNGHYLSVHLPGFKKEQVMVGLAYPGYVTISGERVANDGKCIYFSQALRLPQNLNMNKIGQRFQAEILCLTFPKRVEETDENTNAAAEAKAQEQELNNDVNRIKHDEGQGHDENEEKSKQTDDHVVSVHKEERNRGGMLERAIHLVNNNIILTGVLAFLFGAFMSWRFEPDRD